MRETERDLKRRDTILSICDSSGIDFANYFGYSDNMKKILSEKYPLVNGERFANFVYEGIASCIDRGIVFVVSAGAPTGRFVNKNEYAEKVSLQLLYLLCIYMTDRKPLLNPYYVLKVCDLSVILRMLFDFEKSNEFMSDLTRHEILYIPNFNSSLIHYFSRARGDEDKIDQQKSERMAIYFDDMIRKRSSSKKITVIELNDDYDEVLKCSKVLGETTGKTFVHLQKRANQFDLDDIFESKCCRLHLSSQENDAINAGIKIGITGERRFSDFVRNNCTQYCDDEFKLENLVGEIRKACFEVGVNDGSAFFCLAKIISELEAKENKEERILRFVRFLEEDSFAVAMMLSEMV